jgi:hypothetical protein
MALWSARALALHKMSRPLGEHRSNGNAIAKLHRPPVRAGDEFYGFNFETAIEPNKDFMNEVTVMADAATARGEDPRRTVHDYSTQWNPREHPERFDYVVYGRAQVMRPNPFLPDPNQIPCANIRLQEFMRMPLAEVRSRADRAFSEHSGAKAGDPQ